MNIYDIPFNIINYICSFIQDTDVYTLKSTCKYFNNMFLDLNDYYLCSKVLNSKKRVRYRKLLLDIEISVFETDKELFRYCRYLKIAYNYKHKIEKLPPLLESLKIMNPTYNYELNFPKTLKEIVLSNLYNYKVNWKEYVNLKILHLGNNYDHDIEIYNKLEYLRIGKNFTSRLTILDAYILIIDSNNAFSLITKKINILKLTKNSSINIPDNVDKVIY